MTNYVKDTRSIKQPNEDGKNGKGEWEATFSLKKMRGRGFKKLTDETEG